MRLPATAAKSKNKKKKKKNSKKGKKSGEATCGYEASNEVDKTPEHSPTFYDKHVVNILPNPGW